MNEKIDIPRFLTANLALRARQRSVRRKEGVILALILAAIGGLTAAMWIRYGAAALLFGLPLGLLLLLSRKPWRTFGPNRAGRIETVRYEMRRIPRESFIIRYVAETRCYIKCVCRDADGKPFTVFAEQRYEAVYRPGDRLLKLPGLPLPVDLTPGGYQACPFCGQIYPARNSDCTGCGSAAVEIEREGSYERET